jgi:hypothetical protein
MVSRNSRSVIFYIRSSSSVVGIATVYELDDREIGVRVSVGSRIFTSLYNFADKRRTTYSYTARDLSILVCL